MVSCGAPACTNQVDQNSNITKLDAIIIMLLHVYCDKFRTLAYLMSEAHSKPCQISKMMKHIKNPAIVRTVFSDIFRNIWEHLAIFSHVQAY